MTVGAAAPLLGLLLALVIALVGATPALAAAKTTLPDVEDEVMCVNCGTALNVSQAPSADREREFIRRRIAEGLDKEQIKQRMVAEYGPKVLAEPHQRVSWLVPALLALLGVSTVGLTVRRWRRYAESEPGPTVPHLEPEQQRRLDRDMRAYDL